MTTRSFDLVLYGATGFVGRRAAAYLAQRRMRRKLRWAIAGRDAGKLAALREELAADAESVTLPAIVVAESHDTAAIEAMAASTRVLITHRRSVRAVWRCDRRCLRAPAHALCGHHRRDHLGAARDRPPPRARGARRHAHRAVLRFRFGAVGSRHAAAGAAYRAGVRCAMRRGEGVFPNDGRLQRRHAGHQCASLRDRRGAGRTQSVPAESAGATLGRRSCCSNQDPRSARYDETVGAWVAPFVMGPINTRVVRRSAALNAAYRTPYGPRFRYQEYTKFGPPLAAAKATALAAAMRGLDRAMEQRVGASTARQSTAAAGRRSIRSNDGERLVQDRSHRPHGRRTHAHGRALPTVATRATARRCAYCARPASRWHSTVRSCRARPRAAAC